MKKNIVFTLITLVIGVLLFLFRATGIYAHIAIAALGLVAMALSAALTRKDWKHPALETLMHAFYGIALVSGVVVMRLHGVVALTVLHRLSAVLFAAVLVILLAHKLATRKA